MSALRPPAHPGGRPVAVAALALALLPVLSAPARAHTALSGSRPADGAALDTPPGQVELVFTEAVAPDLATVVVTAPDGAAVAEGDAAVQEATVTQPLAAVTADGRYEVAYRVVAADGHPVTGTLGFSVTGASRDEASVAASPSGTASTEAPEPTGTGPAPTPEESPAATPAATDSPGLPWLPAAAVVAALLALVGALVVRRRGGTG